MLNRLIQSRNTREEKRSTKPSPNSQKMTIETYISIIALNVNGLNAPTKRHRLAEWIQNKTIYKLSIRDPLQTQGHIQTESEEMEKDIPCKWRSKGSWSSNAHIRQHRL